MEARTHSSWQFVHGLDQGRCHTHVHARGRDPTGPNPRSGGPVPPSCVVNAQSHTHTHTVTHTATTRTCRPEPVVRWPRAALVRGQVRGPAVGRDRAAPGLARVPAGGRPARHAQGGAAVWCWEHPAEGCGCGCPDCGEAVWQAGPGRSWCMPGGSMHPTLPAPTLAPSLAHIMFGGAGCASVRDGSAPSLPAASPCAARLCAGQGLGCTLGCMLVAARTPPPPASTLALAGSHAQGIRIPCLVHAARRFNAPPPSHLSYRLPSLLPACKPTRHFPPSICVHPPPPPPNTSAPAGVRSDRRAQEDHPDHEPAAVHHDLWLPSR